MIIPPLLAETLHRLAVLAAATPPATQKSAPPGWATLLTSPIVPIALIFMIMMSFMNRGKRSKDKEREAMLKQLKRGDRIQTIGGVLGTVLRAEESKVEVKVDESTNTKIWFARSAIHRVMEAEKAEAK